MAKEKKKGLRHTETPLYHYWQAFYLSFFSARLYVDVGKRWKGFGVLYLLLLMTLVTIPFGLRVLLDYNRFFDKQMILPLEKIPLIYIQNGQVLFSKPMPYKIKNYLGQVVTIVDTTGEVTTIDKTYPFLSVLITKDKLFYRVPSPQLFFSKNPRQSNTPVYEHPLSKNINEVFNGESWIKSSKILRLKYVSDVILYPSIVSVLLFIYLTICLTFALMGQFIAQLFFRFSLTYKQSCRLILVSVTPQLVIFSAALTLNTPMDGFGLASIALLALYYCFAVLSLKRESSKLVAS